MKKPKKRTECEVYSRIVGYLSPIKQWNEGKRAEWNDRKTFLKNNGFGKENNR